MVAAPELSATNLVLDRPDNESGNAVNEWHGRVVNRAFLGDSVDHVVGIGKIELRNRSNPAQSIQPGTEVYLTIDPNKIALVAD